MNYVNIDAYKQYEEMLSGYSLIIVHVYVNKAITSTNYYNIKMKIIEKFHIGVFLNEIKPL